MSSLLQFSKRAFVLIYISFSFTSSVISQINLKLDSIVSMRYDTTNMSYYLNSRVMMMYDSANYNIYWVRHERDTTLGIWIPEDSAGYTYDSSGNPIEEVYGEWDSGTNSFPQEDKVDIYYNSNNQITGVYGFDYDSGNSTWDSSYYSTRDYNSAQKLETEEQYYWDSGTMQWVGDERKTFNYDSNDKLIEELSFRWNSGTSSWESQAENREDYIYNSTTGFLDTAYYYSWNSISMEFESTFRSVYITDALGNTTVSEDQNFNVGPGWFTTEKSEIDYDVNSPLDQITYPLDYVVDFYRGQVSQLNYRVGYEYDYSADKLYLNDSTTFYYSPATPTGIGNSNNKVDIDFNIYPNPASEVVRVSVESRLGEISTLTITDVSGKQIFQNRIKNSSTISLDGLQSGIYFVNLVSNGKLVSKKLVISE